MASGSKKTLWVLLTFLAVFLAARYLMPLLFPFVLGTAMALAAEPVTALLCRKLKLPRALSTGISVSLAFCMLLALVLLTAGLFLREIGVLAWVLPDLEFTARAGLQLLQDWALCIAGRLPGNLEPLLTLEVTEFFSGGTRILDKAMGWFLGLAGAVLAHVPESALSLGTAIISGFMISAKLPRLKLWLKARFPREKLRPLLDAFARVKSAVGGWLFAQAKLAVITWTLLTLSFWLLKIGYAPLWAFLVALVDVFPILGTGTVLIPWAFISLLQENGARAIGLTGTYLVVMLTRSALEPKLLGKHLGLDPLVTLICMYCGYKIWGIGGMLLAPLLAVTAVQLAPQRRQPS